MKTISRFTAAALLMAATLFSTALFTQARNISGQTTRGIDRRERRESRRIRQGIRRGSLTRREARHLGAQQARIRRHERRAKADGTVTFRERARIRRQENRANRNIYRRKHNWRRR
ncbi:MAG: hypothetical protein M3R68_06270 [Acidobacteriota bacterium]|nr:hypothetical protein [Acidobacteriota bacterium]